jgi:predicted permease
MATTRDPVARPARTRGEGLLDDLRQDLRFALRGLRRNVGFTLVAAATIAIGMGATASIASIANAVLFRPLPVGGPDRLTSIWERRSGRVATSKEGMLVPYERYQAYEEATRDVFSGLAAHRYGSFSFTARDQAETLSGVRTSGNYFEVLGLTPGAGRFYTGDHEAVVVVSAALWRRRFASDPGLIGQTVHMDSRPFVVAGVAPDGFAGTSWGIGVDVWVPAVAYSELTGASNPDWVVPVGRLGPGVQRLSAQQHVDRVAQQIPPEEAQTRVSGARLDPLAWRGDHLPGLTRFLGILMGTSVLVLLIASANLAGMLLARSLGRRREVAVRLAIGAGRGRLVRQLLTENLLLFLIGGIGGVTLAFWVTRLLSTIRLPIEVPTALDLTPDVRVLSGALVLAAVTGVLFGLGPALRASQLDLTSTLKEGLSVTGGRAGRRSVVFVAAQLALTVLLLVTAALFARSLERGLHVDPGFDPNGVVIATTNLGPHGYDEDRARSFFTRFTASAGAMPGVEAVSLARIVLLGGETYGTDVRPADFGASEPPETSALLNVVDTAYFRTMRMDLLAGRGFTSADQSGSPHVVVINQALANRLWPGEDAIGKRLHADGRDYDVVGVLRDGKYQFLTEAPRSAAFFPFSQHFRSRMTLHVRTRSGAGEALAQIAREVQSLDPNVAVEGGRKLASTVQLSLFPQQFGATLTGVFGLVGLVLAALGIYGVLAVHVAQRRREFGIRIALGAATGDVLRLVLGRGALLALIGAAIGLMLAAGATRFVRAFLFGVSPLDPVTFAVIPAVLVVVALAASFIPARRATRADPLETLRQE